MGESGHINTQENSETKANQQVFVGSPLCAKALLMPCGWQSNMGYRIQRREGTLSAEGVRKGFCII